MNNKNFNKKAVTSFIFFLIILLKEIIVNYFELIPVRSKLNRSLSWFGVAPLMIVGAFLSFLVLKNKVTDRKKVGGEILDFSFLMSLPSAIIFIYFLITIIYVLLYSL